MITSTAPLASTAPHGGVAPRVSTVLLSDAALLGDSTLLRDPALLSDSTLLAQVDQAFDAHRRAEARLVELAAEVAQRSSGAGGLADRHGCTSAAALLAHRGGVSTATAQRWCRLATLARPRVMISGDLLEPQFALVGAAVADASVCVESATVITAALAAVSPRALPEHLAAAERALVEFARDHPADTVRRLAAQWRDALDPDGLEPAELVERRALRRTLLASGLKRFVVDLDPEGAAYLDAAIDAAVGAALRRPRFEDADTAAQPEPAFSVTQLGADAVVDLARHGIACDNTAVPLPSTTVVVRMTVESLMQGTGLAQIDGSAIAIPAAVARRMAADAHIIPAVLGGDSAVLDWGLSRRLFTRAQRLALAERDGGCAWTDCHRPPSYTQAHHISWWKTERGPTDLRNGILLCSRHHHAVHDHGWQIEVRDNVPWFIPPSSIDIERRPRRGGRLPAVSQEAA